MEQIVNITNQWAQSPSTQKQTISLYDKWLAFEDSQASAKTFWFIISLVAQGVFFLPVPALLMYYFSAPGYVLVVTLGLFFANVIAGMGGAGIRVLISLFAVSVLIHLLMLAIFMI